MKKNNAVKIGIVVAVLLIGVVYAAITSTLTVSGTAKIKANDSDFEDNVIFASASATTGSTATLSTDKKTITFTTPKFMTTADTAAVLTYTIKNGSNYDASVAVVSCSSSDTNFATYLKATSSRSAALSLAKGATSEAETLTVKMLKTYPDATAKTITYTCTLVATAQ